MHMNSADIAEYNNKYYLVHGDRFSNFLWVYPLKRISTREVMTALWRTFHQMGFPNKLRTDNGTQFTSAEFVEGCREASVEQEWSDPHYPTSNGHAEKLVAVAKSLIKKAKSESDLDRMIQLYNSTPSALTGVSPAEMLMQRKIRTCLPTVNKPGFISSKRIKEATERKRINDEKVKIRYDKSARSLEPLEVGTTVRIFNNKTSRWDMKGTIVFRDKTTGRSYRVLTTNDVYIFRNRRFLKPIPRFDRIPKRWGGNVRFR